MPESARELVSAIGFLPALDMLNHFGGMRVFIPRKPPGGDHPLVVALGAEVVGKLSEWFGSSAFHVPRVASVERLLRDNAIRSDFDAGMTNGVPGVEIMRELVSRYDLTERHIRKALSANGSVSPRARPSAHVGSFTHDLLKAQREAVPQ